MTGQPDGGGTAQEGGVPPPSGVPAPLTPIDLNDLEGLTPGQVEALSGPDEPSPAVKKPLKPQLAKYDPEPGRDDVRRNIAYWLLALLTGVIATAFGLLAFADQLGVSTDDLRTFLELIFTPVVTLLGAVTGFYYGINSRDK